MLSIRAMKNGDQLLVAVSRVRFSENPQLVAGGVGHFLGNQGGVITSLTLALVTPSTPSRALTADCSIPGPAGQAGEVDVIST